MSASSSNFTFGRDFSQGASTSPFIDTGKRLPVPYREHLRLLEEARASAMQAGILEGRRLQLDQETQRLAQGLEAIGQRLEIAVAGMQALERNARVEALAFARIFAGKLAGRMIETAPIQAIEATARAIFGDLRGSPHLAIRVAPDLVDATKARIGTLMKENGLEAKLFVFPDPDIAFGDCRIEWADGGIVRDQSKLAALVDRSVAMLFPDQD